jgi:hypothetical protein
MIIRAYRVKIHHPGLHGGPHPDPVPVAIVQITKDISELSGAERDVEVLDFLAISFPDLANHTVYGSSTWESELISIPDDELGTPTVEDISEGFRVWRQL